MNDAAPIVVADQPRLGRLYRLQWEEAQKSWVLLYPEGMVKLNGSAAEIMTRCDGARTVAQIVDDLQRAFGTEGLEPDVLAFLEMACGRGWIQAGPAGARR
jgi:pyrroloquinoline quinone biosynthesis protein D